MSEIEELREQVRRLPAERAALIVCLRRGVMHARKLGHALGWMTSDACEIAGIPPQPNTVASSSGRHAAKAPRPAHVRGR